MSTPAGWLNMISGPAYKVSAAGEGLSFADRYRRDHAAIHLPMHGIWVSAEPIALDARQSRLEDLARELYLAGQRDWTLGHIDYLQLLINRERGRPYFDPEYFRGIPDYWCWSSTGADIASNAWFACAKYGDADIGGRVCHGFGLAVRRVGGAP